MYTDPGTEKGLVGGIQGYLRADGLDEYAWSQSHKYVTSNCIQGWVVNSDKFCVGVYHPDSI